MRSRVPALVVVCLFGLSVRAAWAQPTAEVGSSLTSLVFQTDKYADITTFGVGAATTLEPSVYASFFVGSNAAIEPRVGLLWESSGGHSDHVVTAALQFDYFAAGAATRSPFVFVGGGISDASGPGVNPKYVLVGGGMRLPAGDRLVFRLDAHYSTTQTTTGMPSPLDARLAASSIAGSGLAPLRAAHATADGGDRGASAPAQQTRAVSDRRLIITRQIVQNRMRLAAKRANVKNGVHILRHTFCSLLAMRGAPGAIQ